MYGFLVKVKKLMIALESSGMMTFKEWLEKVFMYVFQDDWLQTCWCQDLYLQGISDLWKTPKHSSLFWLLPGCLRGHVYARPWSLIKIPDPNQEWDSLSFSFLSLPDNSVCIWSLCLQQILLSLPAGQGHSWLILQDPIWVLESSLPASPAFYS